jgi:hypothetical protein
MKLLFLPLVTVLFALLVSCSKYQVRELDYDDRLVDEEDLLEMPAFERNQEVCKRSILALQRAEILAGISAQLSQIAAAKDNVVTNGKTCHVEYLSDCINCSSRRVNDCYYDESVSDVWHQLEYRKKDLMLQASRIRDDGQKHYAQCSAYLSNAAADHALEVHMSGLEPPLFAPTPILPVDMSEQYDALILATGIVIAASADAYIQAKYD